jgi:hypothetical protein
MGTKLTAALTAGCLGATAFAWRAQTNFTDACLAAAKVAQRFLEPCADLYTDKTLEMTGALIAHDGDGNPSAPVWKADGTTVPSLKTARVGRPFAEAMDGVLRAEGPLPEESAQNPADNENIMPRVPDTETALPLPEGIGAPETPALHPSVNGSEDEKVSVLAALTARAVQEEAGAPPCAVVGSSPARKADRAQIAAGLCATHPSRCQKLKDSAGNACLALRAGTVKNNIAKR